MYFFCQHDISHWTIVISQKETGNGCFMAIYVRCIFFVVSGYFVWEETAGEVMYIVIHFYTGGGGSLAQFDRPAKRSSILFFRRFWAKKSIFDQNMTFFCTGKKTSTFAQGPHTSLIPALMKMIVQKKLIQSKHPKYIPIDSRIWLLLEHTWNDHHRQKTHIIIKTQKSNKTEWSSSSLPSIYFWMSFFRSFTFYFSSVLISSPSSLFVYLLSFFRCHSTFECRRRNEVHAFRR